MMIFRSDSVSRDIDNYHRAEARAEKKLPRCSVCDGKIQADKVYYINGELICTDCMEDYLHDTDEFLEG